ncbi:MAG: AAA family ATPase [Elusimicrobiota bacterium]|jgi:predicted ABC-type ATPase|nr:AAA family ATPase [Elusimicrobiota bacterium]
MKKNAQKKLIIATGANGSGKTTVVLKMLDKYKNFLFLNADDAAKRLNPSNIDEVKLAAGKETIKKFMRV